MRIATELTFLFCVFLVTGGSKLSSEPKALISTSTVAVPKEFESIDFKSGGQLLELIVKIAEHPDTWKQIHRVLETLEANNAAYSNRITSAKNKLEQQVQHRPVATTDHFSDKRNDVPEKLAEAQYRDSEKTYQQWKDTLFADESFHPQMKLVEQIDNISNSPAIQLPPFERERPNYPAPLTDSLLLTSASSTENERSFDDRLKEIEKELRKLSKLSRLASKKHNHWKSSSGNEKETNSSQISFQLSDDKMGTSNLTKVSKIPHKFLYHRVGNTSDEVKRAGNNLWKKITSADNNGSSTRKKTFVAVSLLPNPQPQQKSQSSPKPPMLVDTSHSEKGKNYQKKTSSGFLKPRRQKYEKNSQTAKAKNGKSKD